MSPYSRLVLKLGTLLLLFLCQSRLFAAAQDTCGSLITYRQYSTELEAAPQCFIDGCTSQTKPASMSDVCPQGHACSELWNLISDKYQQDWCSSCTQDVACRISGWPILNASALCDTAPNTWIFGTTGSCCTTGNEPFELAEWIGTMCNGSEWRKPFEYYGGMAQLDWEEWLLPWNWTVRAENASTIFVQVQPSHCSRTPLALLAFAAENILFLIFAVGISIAKIQYIRGARAKLAGCGEVSRMVPRSDLLQILAMAKDVSGAEATATCE